MAGDRVLYLDGEMDAAELARRSYLLAPSLSRILRDLEAAGYLKRRPGAADSRQSLLSLSPKASAMVSGAAPMLDRIHREIARRVAASASTSCWRCWPSSRRRSPTRKKENQGETTMMTRRALAATTALLSYLAAAPPVPRTNPASPTAS